VTDGKGNKVNSNAASITVGQEIKITRQPEDINVPAGTSANFVIEAEGEGLSYQWQYQKTAGSDWVNFAGTAAQTSSMKKKIQQAWNGWKVRCVINDANGNKATSDQASINVTE
jgi:hypothetical protein